MAKSQILGRYKDTGILTTSMGGVVCGSWAPLLAVFVVSCVFGVPGIESGAFICKACTLALKHKIKRNKWIQVVSINRT